jgi:hypothetical protein
MAFTFTEEDYSGHEGEPEEALGSLLSHIEFDTIEDLWLLARGIRANVDFIYLIEALEDDPGLMGYHLIHQDGSHEVVMHCSSVLISVHELSHCYLHQQKEDHGPLFKKRMARLIEKAEKYLEDKIEVPEVEEVSELYSYTPRDRGQWWKPAPACEDVPLRSEAPLLLWQPPDGMKEVAA